MATYWCDPLAGAATAVRSILHGHTDALAPLSAPSGAAAGKLDRMQAQLQGIAGKLSALGPVVALSPRSRGHVLRPGANGLVMWSGKVNGRPLQFLVDTGASASAVPASLAGDLGLLNVGRAAASGLGGRVSMDTFMGEIELEGDVKASLVTLYGTPNFNHGILGMDVLGKLPVSIEAGFMRIGRV